MPGRPPGTPARPPAPAQLCAPGVPPDPGGSSAPGGWGAVGGSYQPERDRLGRRIPGDPARASAPPGEGPVCRGRRGGGARRAGRGPRRGSESEGGCSLTAVPPPQVGRAGALRLGALAAPARILCRSVSAAAAAACFPRRPPPASAPSSPPPTPAPRPRARPWDARCHAAPAAALKDGDACAPALPAAPAAAAAAAVRPRPRRGLARCGRRPLR